jgi:endonuclease/exonuclease/phosphatase (EEP) superfamily protein YafD
MRRPWSAFWFMGLKTLSAVSIVVGVLPFLALQSWLFDLFSHFRIQLLAAQIGLLGLLALGRKFSWCIAVAVSLVANGYAVRSYLLPAAETTSSGHVIKVMTVNAWRGNRTFAGLVESIRREAPDVVVVQEYGPRAARGLAPLHSLYPYRFERPREDVWGLALLSRIPLRSAHEFSLGGSLGVDAVLAMNRGPVRVLGVHLRSPLSARAATEQDAQLEHLAAMARGSSEPVIVLGDFNLTPYSPRFARFKREARLQDTRAGRGPGISWPSYLPLLGIPIDHCFVSSDWRVLGQRRQKAFGSDHYPILFALGY